MKKIISLLLAALLLASLLSSCVKISVGPAADQAQETPGEEDAYEDEDVSDTEDADADEDEPFDMGEFLTGIAEENPGLSPEAFAEEILKSPYFTLFSPADTEYYYPGLNYEYTPEGIKECACIYDWITNSGALVYIMTTEEGTDPAALASAFEENADPKWMDFDGDGLDGVLTSVMDGKVFFAMYQTDMKPVTGTVAEKARDFVDIFHEYLAEHPDASCLELADYFVTHQKFNGLYSTPVEEGNIMGFGDYEHQAEITGFSDGAGFIPMMSPNLFIGYVFELPDGADIDAFVSMLEENANLAWNVCMVANTVITETDGNKVLFMMCSEGEAE